MRRPASVLGFPPFSPQFIRLKEVFQQLLAAREVLPVSKRNCVKLAVLMNITAAVETVYESKPCGKLEKPDFFRVVEVTDADVPNFALKTWGAALSDDVSPADVTSVVGVTDVVASLDTTYGLQLNTTATSTVTKTPTGDTADAVRTWALSTFELGTASLTEEVVEA